MRSLVLLSLFASLTDGCSEPKPSAAPPHEKRSAPQEETAQETICHLKQSKPQPKTVTQSQCSLGYAYDVGEGVTQNIETAAHWYRQAAEQGYANAQFNLAEMIRDGAGVPQSNEDAFGMVHQSCDAGTLESPIQRRDDACKGRGCGC